MPRGVRLPSRPPARERILSAAQVDALAERLGEHGDLVLAMGYLGLRWSELAALRVADVDLTRNRVRTVERATEVGGRMDVLAPKSRASARQVAIPAFLRPVLISRVGGKQLDDLVFPAPGGGYPRNGNWRNRSGWRAAVMELGLTGVTPHDLRRTFGRLARSAGLICGPEGDGPRVDHHHGAHLRPSVRRRARPGGGGSQRPAG